MLDHHIQRSIVYRLAFVDKLRFSELKPDILENKLFTYHLKKTIAAGYVLKNTDGTYALTSQGRLSGATLLDNTEALTDQAYSVLFLVIKRASDGAWLLYKRKTHPLLNRYGFMHCTPNASETIVVTAARVTKEKTGLECSYTVLGSGFFRIFEDHKLESFTNFTLLGCEDAMGELTQQDSYAEYFWQSTVDEKDPELLPNMSILLDHYKTKTLFFGEHQLRSDVR